MFRVKQTSALVALEAELERLGNSRRPRSRQHAPERLQPEQSAANPGIVLESHSKHAAGLIAEIDASDSIPSRMRSLHNLVPSSFLSFA